MMEEMTETNAYNFLNNWHIYVSMFILLTFQE